MFVSLPSQNLTPTVRYSKLRLLATAWDISAITKGTLTDSPSYVYEVKHTMAYSLPPNEPRKQILLVL